MFEKGEPKKSTKQKINMNLNIHIFLEALPGKNVQPMTTRDFQNKSCERLNPLNIFLQYSFRIIGNTYLERKKGHGQSLVHYFLHLSCQQTGSWQWEYFIFNENSFPSKAPLKTNSSAFMFQHLFLNITHMTVPIYYIVDS